MLRAILDGVLFRTQVRRDLEQHRGLTAGHGPRTTHARGPELWRHLKHAAEAGLLR